MAQVQDASFIFPCRSWDYWLQLYDCHSNVSFPWLWSTIHSERQIIPLLTTEAIFLKI